MSAYSEPAESEIRPKIKIMFLCDCVWGSGAGGTNLSKKTMCVCVLGFEGVRGEMGRRYQHIKENIVCVFGGGGGLGWGRRWAGYANLSKKTMCVCWGVGAEGSGAEMGRRYQPVKEHNVCVGHLGGGGRGLRWATCTNLSKKTLCVCVRGWGQRVRGLRWAGGTSLSKNTMCACVLGGGGAGRGLRWATCTNLSKKTLCVCLVGGGGVGG